jgi:NTP pyrophosphatase (non-canonical NTP hydrolase)
MNKETQNLHESIIQFRENRDWKQFHKIKDLLLGLSIEVSELQELFLWKNEDEISNIDKEKIQDEIADIFIFISYICEDFNIDLYDSVRNKIAKNNIKYPLAKSKGSNKKYNQLK